KIIGGFHDTNTLPADQEAAFTDGAGLTAIAGLLRDFPGENTPAWSGFWDLGNVSADLTEIRVFSGNPGKDGRVWHHYDVYTTTDPAPAGGSTWTPQIGRASCRERVETAPGAGSQKRRTERSPQGGRQRV